VNVAVHNALLLWLQTNRPMLTEFAIVIVFVAMGVQVVPFAER
jgi:hypothetical protein